MDAAGLFSCQADDTRELSGGRPGGPGGQRRGPPSGGPGRTGPARPLIVIHRDIPGRHVEAFFGPHHESHASYDFKHEHIYHEQGSWSGLVWIGIIIVAAIVLLIILSVMFSSGPTTTVVSTSPYVTAMPATQ